MFLWFLSYYSSGCTGKQRENMRQNAKISVCVNVGGIKCLVESQYVSNHDFLEVIVWLEFVTYHFFFTHCVSMLLSYFSYKLDSLISVDLVGLMYFTSLHNIYMVIWGFFPCWFIHVLVQIACGMAKSNDSFFFLFPFWLLIKWHFVSNSGSIKYGRF